MIQDRLLRNRHYFAEIHHPYDAPPSKMTRFSKVVRSTDIVVKDLVGFSSVVTKNGILLKGSRMRNYRANHVLTQSPPEPIRTVYTSIEPIFTHLNQGFLSPAFEKNYLRYGPVVLEMDLEAFLNKYFPNACYYLLGTIKYWQEHSHRILVTDKHYILCHPKIDLINGSQIFRLRNEGEWEWLHQIGPEKDTKGKWEHLEFAVDLPETGISSKSGL